MNKELRVSNHETFKIERREENGKRCIIGLIPYGKRSVNMNPWAESKEEEIYEVIDNTAFSKTLGDGGEVRALFSHDDSKILGSTKSGTLKLESIPMGLQCTCELPNTSAGNDAWEIIGRGDCSTMSFGFYVDQYEEIGQEVHLKSVRLVEVSFCVAFPAYPDTDSITELRNAIGFLDEEKRKKAIELLKREFLTGHSSQGPEKIHPGDEPSIRNINELADGLLRLAEAELL